MRVLVTVGVALALFVQLPSLEPIPASPNAPVAASLVTFRTDATIAEIRDAGAQPLESYGAFVIARGFPSSLTALAARGRYAAALPRASFLELLHGPVDVRALASRAPSWAPDAQGEAVGVVHFYGPIKPAWQETLETRGAEVLRYLPQDAFIVRGRPSDLQALSSLPFVDWIGSYEPAWKIRGATSMGGVTDVRIVIFPGRSPESVEAWLAHHGVPAEPTVGDGPAILGVFGSEDFRWVRARAPGALIPDLTTLPAVEFIDPVRPVHAWNAQTDWVMQTNLVFPNRTADYRYWRYGLNGSGVTIGMADTGLDYDGAQFRQGVSPSSITIGDIYNDTNVNRRKVVRYVNMGVLTGQLTWPGGGGLWDPWSIKDCADGHGTGVASTLAGNRNGTGGSSPNDGNALGAKIYLEDIGGFQGIALCPNEGLIYLPENYDNLFGPPRLVYNDPIAPVRVHSDSWGADTNDYDIQARMVDAFVWSHPDLTVLFAAGNAGSTSGSVGTPATAKNIVTVGGAYNPDSSIPGGTNDLADLSSRGPTLDGRIKPTILTIFDGDSAMSDGDPSSGTGLSDLHWQGTSYSTPAAAAAAAIVRQYFVSGWYPAARPVPGNGMNPSAALVRAMLIASGVQITGSGTVARSSTDTWPNNEQGFGRVLLSKVLPIAAAGDTFRTQVYDGTAGLLTGDTAAFTFRVTTAGPAKFVLTWSDYPGTLGATKALVNDIDLEVTAPNGTVYRGNHFAAFAQGQSLAGGTFDTTNVEEAVILKSANAGDWTVRVIGSNVAVGPQPFAVVATGNLDTAYGRVLLDRVAYSEADTIRISVEDADTTSVVVHVASGIEPAGEDVTLTRVGPDEIWRGTIRTTFGSASPDGVLQVRERDTITAVYQDASPAHTATAQARVLASGPTIHDVSVSDIGATSATVRWATNEPATAEMMYGTNPASLDLRVNGTDLRTDHATVLTRLAPDTDYYFEVVSRGRLGNATRDTNGGRLYRFRTASWGDVLLVVGGDSFPPEREASYAAALRSNGWTWSLWRVAELGLPPLGLLQDRRSVIWQVGLEQYPPFNASARALVQSYLDGGGRLLVSSHDAAWALGSSSSPFSTSETEAWVRGVLKATFQCDPATIGQVKGLGSDPISGAYTGGVSYTPHRGGAADDQLSLNTAGGVSTTVWTDSQVVSPPPPAPQCAQNRPVGLRWVSSAANGTNGVGEWGGTRSRLVYFAFEVTGMDAKPTDLNPSSPTRAAVLDSALRWLGSTATTSLDRDHPDVAITSPNGGVFTGASITIDWTATAYGTGIGIANFTLDSSADGGQIWTRIATLVGSDRSYIWNLGTTPNGNRYLLRIVAHDNGTPSLSGEDATDAALTISHPGGDIEGPILWAGSVRVDPQPPGAGQTVTLSATADDRSRGANRVAAAELFLRTAQPAASENGTGLAMVATDGAFDGPIENVSWQGGLPAAPGVTCGWAHANDTAGNWGPYASLCFVVIFVGPDTAPPAKAGLDGIHFAALPSNLTIEWASAWDEGLYGGTVAYRVQRAPSPTGVFSNVSGVILANGSARYAFVDPGRGTDLSAYFYRIETIDALNNSATTDVLAAKILVPFSSGFNLLGMPLELTNSNLSSAIAGTSWNDAWTYDACAGGFGWSSIVPSDTATVPLPSGRGFWLNVTAGGSFFALGLLPAVAQLHLCAGWNLASLPSLTSTLRVGDLRAATGADSVLGFDSSDPNHIRVLADSEVLAPGRGYWVHVRQAADWLVVGW